MIKVPIFFDIQGGTIGMFSTFKVLAVSQLMEFTFFQCRRLLYLVIPPSGGGAGSKTT